MALQSNLTVPAVRFWAETQGRVLGIYRDAAGEWHFSPQAAAFLRQLGEMQPPPTAVATEPGRSDSESGGAHSESGSAHSKSGSPRSESEIAVSRPVPSPPHRPEPSRQRMAQGAADGAGLHRQLHRLAEALQRLERRHDDTADRAADLAEEVKEMQILLSRMMELLTPPVPRGERRRIVRPWRPPRV